MRFSAAITSMSLAAQAAAEQRLAPPQPCEQMPELTAPGAIGEAPPADLDQRVRHSGEW